MTATLHLDRKNGNSTGHLQTVAFLKQKRSPTTPASPAFCGNMNMRTKWEKEEDILVRWISIGYQSLQASCPESTSPKPRNSHFPPRFLTLKGGVQNTPAFLQKLECSMVASLALSFLRYPSPFPFLKSPDHLPCISEKFTKKILNIQEYSVTNSQVSTT